MPPWTTTSLILHLDAVRPSTFWTKASISITRNSLVNAERQVIGYVVSYDLTLLPTTPNRALWAPNDVTDYNGHGTLVASVAGEITHGVASKANLVLVKFRNAALNPLPGGSGNYVYRQVNELAMEDAWSWVINDVLTKRQNGSTGKFIVNMSFGMYEVPKLSPRLA